MRPVCLSFLSWVIAVFVVPARNSEEGSSSARTVTKTLASQISAAAAGSAERNAIKPNIDSRFFVMVFSSNKLLNSR